MMKKEGEYYKNKKLLDEEAYLLIPGRQHVTQNISSHVKIVLGTGTVIMGALMTYIFICVTDEKWPNDDTLRRNVLIAGVIVCLENMISCFYLAYRLGVIPCRVRRHYYEQIESHIEIISNSNFCQNTTDLPPTYESVTSDLPAYQDTMLSYQNSSVHQTEHQETILSDQPLPNPDHDASRPGLQPDYSKSTG